MASAATRCSSLSGKGTTRASSFVIALAAISTRSTKPRSRRPRSDTRQPGASSSSQSSVRTLASNVASSFGLPLRIAGRAVWPASFNAQP